MAISKPDARRLVEKIRTLPPEKVAEVEDFVDFLRARERERQVRHEVSRLSEPAFARIWDNADDADYDRL